MTQGTASGKLGDATQSLLSPSAMGEGSSKCSVSSLGTAAAPAIPLALGQQLLPWEAALPAQPCSWRKAPGSSCAQHTRALL